MTHQQAIITPDRDLHPSLSLDDVLSQIVDSKRLKYERDLFMTKWWDYRFLTATEATFKFVDHFGQQSRILFARDIDSERAPYIAFPTGAVVKEKLLIDCPKTRQQFSGFWRARQVADAMGCPYDIYCYEALNNRLRYWASTTVRDKKGRIRNRMPTPNQIYEERSVERVQARWDEIRTNRMIFATHDAFKVQNYIGAKIQNLYFDALIERAGISSNRILALADMVRDERIPREYLIKAVDAGTFESVVKSLA